MDHELVADGCHFSHVLERGPAACVVEILLSRPSRITDSGERQPRQPSSSINFNMDVDSTPHSQLQTGAIEAFSSTFLFRERFARRQNAWNKLPVELPLIIFGLVYSDIFKFPWHTRLLLEEDFTSASLFPYAIASVCTFWRDAMSFQPKFWQRIIIFIDDTAILPSTLATQFSWSHEDKIDVVISRRSFDHVNRQHERSQIAMIMKVLGSHIHRIRELRFDVMFSSSLPSYPNGFHGTATYLRKLSLRFKEDDGALIPQSSSRLRAQNMTSSVLDSTFSRLTAEITTRHAGGTHDG